MTYLLDFKDIKKGFDREDHYLSVSGHVDGGEVLLVRGPSGAGKSTLLKILARIIAPDRGMMYWQGKSYKEIEPTLWRQNIHYVPQRAVMFSGSVLENLKLPFALTAFEGKMSFNEEQAFNYMDLLGLNRDILDQHASTLSGGESSRVALIRALLIKPQVLLLDEPTAALDAERRDAVMRLLGQWLKEEEKRAIMIVSHNNEDADRLPPYRILDVSMHRGDE